MDQTAEIASTFPEVSVPAWKATSTIEQKARQALDQTYKGIDRINRYKDALLGLAPSRVTVGFLMAMAGITLFGHDQANVQKSILNPPQPIIIDTRVAVESGDLGFEEMMFAKYSPAERTEARSKIQQQLDHFKEIRKMPMVGELMFQKKINDTLRWKSLADEIVSDSRLEIPPSQRKFWSEFLIALVYTESKGDSNANPGNTPAEKAANGKGLGQITEPIAKRAAAALDIKNYDIFDAKTNMLFTAQELRRLQKLLGGNLDLVIWSYFNGEGTVGMAMHRQAISKLQTPVAQADTDFSDLSGKATSSYGQRPEMNIIAIQNNPAVTAELKSKRRWDDNIFTYVDRVKASWHLLFNNGEIPQTSLPNQSSISRFASSGSPEA